MPHEQYCPAENGNKCCGLSSVGKSSFVLTDHMLFEADLDQQLQRVPRHSLALNVSGCNVAYMTESVTHGNFSACIVAASVLSDTCLY